jgi:hypothetical protein
MVEIANHPEGGFAAVIVEASWESILYDPPPDLRMTPKSVYRSILAWQQRAPTNRIHWLLMDTRDMAERFCFRILERFWDDEQERLNPPKRRAKKQPAAQAIGQPELF